MCVCVCVCVSVKERKNMCVCESEREREREREREYVRVRVCMHVRVRSYFHDMGGLTGRLEYFRVRCVKDCVIWCFGPAPMRNSLFYTIA